MAPAVRRRRAPQWLLTHRRRRVLLLIRRRLLPVRLPGTSRDMAMMPTTMAPRKTITAPRNGMHFRKPTILKCCGTTPDRGRLPASRAYGALTPHERFPAQNFVLRWFVSSDPADALRAHLKRLAPRSGACSS